MAPAARRAAAAAGRYLAATARSAAAASPRAAVIHRAGRRAAAIHQAGRRAAAPAPSTVSIRQVPPSPCAVAIRQASPSPCAGAIRKAPPSACAGAIRKASPPPCAGAIHQWTLSGVAIRLLSSSVAATRSSTCTAAAHSTSNRAAGRLGPRAYPFKAQRRMIHTQRDSIPDDIKAELHRIDSQGLRLHKELQKSVLLLSKQVAEQTANAKALKVDATWQMGRTAWAVCSTVLATAACSGYAILKFVKFGSGIDSQVAAGSMIDSKIEELKVNLENRMDEVLEKKDKEEAWAFTHKQVELDKISQQLDKKEADLEKREAAVAAREAAAKEAAAKQPPKG